MIWLGKEKQVLKLKELVETIELFNKPWFQYRTNLTLGEQPYNPHVESFQADHTNSWSITSQAIPDNVTTVHNPSPVSNTYTGIQIIDTNQTPYLPLNEAA